MMCVLCGLSRRINKAVFTVFGLSCCGHCSDRLVTLLADGASVREILIRAKAGDW